MPTTLDQQLNSLKQRLLGDQEIAQLGLAQNAQQLVFGVGNPQSQLMFIGEAPGVQEDRLGQPFIGRAGQLLDAWLSELGFDRTEVWLTNLVKHRPPSNRDPLPNEKARYSLYLEQEIALIKPQIIVSLGRHATGYFSADLTMAQSHGQPYKINYQTTSETLKLTLWPFYHPAAILYNPRLASVVRADIQKLKEYLKS